MTHPKIVSILPLPRICIPGDGAQLWKDGQETVFSCQFLQSLPQMQRTLLKVMPSPQWQLLELDCQPMPNLSGWARWLSVPQGHHPHSFIHSYAG